jgi:hypothetical protein
MLVVATACVIMMSSLRRFRTGVDMGFGHLMAHVRIVVTVL